MRATLLHGCGLAVLAMSFGSARAMDVGPYAIDLQLDLRAVAVDSPYASSVHGGLGQLRFDDDHEGLRLGRALAAFNGPLTETIRADVTLSATGDGDQNIVDVTEAFLEWRPYPRNSLRWRTRVGAFYPAISLENRAIGWQSPYSISSSGINTWVGEELRAVGVEQSLAILGAPSGRDYTVGLVAGAYRWNDPAGVLLFQRGWAIHDRQTPLFGALDRPNSGAPTAAPIEPFREIDDRIGYYAGAEYKYAGQHVLRALRYDNRGDPSKRSGADSTWRTRFNSLGWRSELPSDTTLIAQGMRGDTSVGVSDDGRGALILEYWSYFILASQQVGQHRFTARYDRMYAESTRGAVINDQSATAWTLAYLWDMNRSWQFALEGVRVGGALQQRARVGLESNGTERMVQLAARYSL